MSDGSGRTSGRSRSKSRSRTRVSPPRFGGIAQFFGRRPWQFWLLAGFVCAVFVLGGTSRMDSAELIVLRPLSALVLATGCMTLQWQQIVRYRYLFGLALGCVVTVAIQLIPLPPQIFGALPGHTLVTAVDRMVGNTAIWRPLSMSPIHTWNALWATMAPIAVLVLGAQTGAGDLRRLLPLVLVLGVISAALGIVQMVSDPHSPLYLYETVSEGLPIGLFANRNHQAVFLASLLIMLAAWAARPAPRRGHADAMAGDAGTASRAMHKRTDHSRSGRAEPGQRTSGTWRKIVGAAIGLALLPVILGTGSRSGLAMTVVACLCIPLVYRGRRAAGGQRVPGASLDKTRARGWPQLIARARQVAPYVAPYAAPIVGLGIVVSAIWLGRAESVDRLLGQDLTQDLRFQVLPVARAMAGQFWPLGSGFGTFLPVFRAFEPDGMLSPRIVVQVNNDWIEVVLTAGLPGVLLLLTAVVLWLVRARTVLRLNERPSHYAALGLMVILIFALASVTDYPARVPAISCLIVVAALWSVMRDEYAGIIRGSDVHTDRTA